METIEVAPQHRTSLSIKSARWPPLLRDRDPHLISGPKSVDSVLRSRKEITRREVEVGGAVRPPRT